MIDVSVRGYVMDILWRGKKTMHFIIKKDNAFLKAKIPLRNLHLADMLVVGKEYEFTGTITAYLTIRDGYMFGANDFYISDIVEIPSGGEVV